jgi:LytS/YehU family sensor histidine kinase
LDQGPVSTKTLAEYKLEALRSQMNPHFIFNAITAIQHFILNNEKESALTYLDELSHLIRKFLDHSRHATISLSEEIELLIAYINLESMRFSDKFGFVLNMDDNIDTDEIQLPSMLIQPYVENAIKHGLMHKKEYGLLQIHFHLLNKELLQVIIEDNGIGRKASAKMNSWRNAHHKSLGMEVTQQRLDILNEIHNNGLRMTVEDVTEDAEETGTRITIYIPLEDDEE